MVANIRSGSSPGGALYYNKEKVDKNEAEVLLWQKMLEPFNKHGRMDIDACMESFRPYLEANRRTTNTVFHVSLNPSPEDRLTDERLRDIAREYMERMGYGEQPYSSTRTFPESISISCRCGSMSRAANSRTISRPGARWKFCVIWSGNTVCIRVSKARNKQTGSACAK